MIAGITAAFVLMGTVPGLGMRFVPHDVPLPDPSREDPVTV